MQLLYIYPSTLYIHTKVVEVNNLLEMSGGFSAVPLVLNGWHRDPQVQSMECIIRTKSYTHYKTPGSKYTHHATVQDAQAGYYACTRMYIHITPRSYIAREIRGGGCYNKSIIAGRHRCSYLGDTAVITRYYVHTHNV